MKETTNNTIFNPDEELEREKSRINKHIGIENLQGFRDDVKEIYLENREKSFEDLNKRREVIVSEQILEAYKKNYTRTERYLKGIRKFDALFGIITLFFSFGVSMYLSNSFVSSVLASLLVSGIFYFLNLSHFLGKATFDILSYPTTTKMSKEEIAFRKAWNEGILGSNIGVLAVFIMALIKKHTNNLYEDSMDSLAEQIKGLQKI